MGHGVSPRFLPLLHSPYPDSMSNSRIILGQQLGIGLGLGTSGEREREHEDDQEEGRLSDLVRSAGQQSV